MSTSRLESFTQDEASDLLERMREGLTELVPLPCLTPERYRRLCDLFHLSNTMTEQVARGEMELVNTGMRAAVLQSLELSGEILAACKCEEPRSEVQA